MSIHAISPLDGRYQEQLEPVAACFCERALMANRVRIEIEWLITLAARPEIGEVRALLAAEIEQLRAIAGEFDDAAALRVKAIEATTRHDVKAVEYYLKERLAGTSVADLAGWLHFACTSEDINNLSYALMLRDGVRDIWLPQAHLLVSAVAEMARAQRAVPMPAHTHGQPASPTTVGKELAVFARRWQRQLLSIERLEYLGKLNGAVGNFNAHLAAYPSAPWQQIARAFVEGLGLTYNPLTTQIESHDSIAEACQSLARFNSIAIDFDRDLWTYISKGYFKQRVVAGEVGSSTMPHKVNPINFENSEANLELSNALLNLLAARLPISRLQRDLTDSSTLRNLGVAIGHSYLALRAALRGLGELSVNDAALRRDLDPAWEVLGEAVQTVMRKAGHDDPYEKLKELTRGERIDGPRLRAFIGELDLPPDDRERLLALTPAGYIGLAAELVDWIE